MRKRGVEGAASLNVWIARGTWFWSLFYPDRRRGAVGAAVSEAEAVMEAQAALADIAQMRDDAAACQNAGASSFAARFHTSKHSRICIASTLARGTHDFECSKHSWNRTINTQTIATSYNHLWQLTLQQYAARVAGA
jgi:hypothetical protein